MRIHILGASGSGTTTLGRALARELAIDHFDADAFYWEQTDPPFTVKRPVAERIRILRPLLLQSEHWALSGSMVNWCEGIDVLLTHIVFLHLPVDVRLARLAAREATRYGARALPGGDMHDNVQEFLAWAARYDKGGLDMRSRALHEQWLQRFTCPVIELCSLEPVDALVQRVWAWLAENPFDERIARRKKFEEIARRIGEEMEHRGLSEEEVFAELEQIKQDVYNERYGSQQDTDATS